MSGFVAAYREAVEHPLFKGNAERLGAWMWLVMRAAWKPTPFDIGGKIITIERGQLCTSRAQLAKAWGMSPSGVERFLTRLKTEQMIEQATGQGRSVITICNYDKYQNISDEAGQAAEQATGQRSDSHRTAKEQGNKGTRDIEPNGPISHSAQAREPKAAKESVKKVPMTPDWQPAPLPPTIAALTDLWPPGRLAREADQFRDYWLDRTEKRPGWDRSFHNRIRDIHDRVLRENRNGNGTYHNQPDTGTNDPVVQAIIAGKARRAGQQQHEFGVDAGSWPPDGGDTPRFL